MATFTLTDDKTIVPGDHMRLGDKMRLHLAGIGGDRKASSYIPRIHRLPGVKSSLCLTGRKGSGP